MVWNNLLSFLAGGTVGRERRETEELYTRVRTKFAASAYQDEVFPAFRIDIIFESIKRADRIPIGPVVDAIGRLVGDLVDMDFLVFGFLEVPNLASLTPDEGVELRTYLKRKERFLLDPKRQEEQWRNAVVSAVAGLLHHLPATLFKDDWDDPDPDSDGGPTVPMIDLIDKPAEAIERLFGTMISDDVLKADLFAELREQFDRRVLAASGVEWSERFETKRKLVPPSQYKVQQPSLLVDRYLDGTPWRTFFLTELPFVIPFPVRFEHTHIVGGSGHGKTQLLQLSILRDLEACIDEQRSLIVIDSQGDLIQTISRLDVFAPDHPSGLAERLMIVDPTDMEFPVALNMFDFDRGSMDRLPLVQRERLLNATIDLYEYFFGALLGAELTARQGIIFKYIARLLLEVPDATIHSLRQLMEDGEPFRPFMAKLPSTARAFFETRFFDRSFSETKKQVLTRLWGVLSNSTFDRMFSHPRSKVDIYSAMQSGKIVLINTAKDLLNHDGAAILGRFFIALIAQAAQRRATMPGHERTPTFVYIDEAADYFDDTVDHLLNQARKYKVGMVLAHQNLDQLSASLRASISASTSIKYAGGVSSKDASAFASEMRTPAEFIQGMRKREKETMFACYVRNVTPQALGVSVPLGVVECEPRMSETDWEEIRARNRSAYCIPLADVPEATFTPRPTYKKEPRPVPQPEQAGAPASGATAPPPLPPESPVHAASRRPTRMDPDDLPALGRGGRDHKYLQNLIREFAVSKGFRAIVEQEILDGAGHVDVALSRKDLNLACEISVTTGRDHELANIEKCLAAGFQIVLVVSRDEKYRNTMARTIKGVLDEEAQSRVQFASPEEALHLIDRLAGNGTSESTIKGYKVKVSHSVVDPDEADRRKKAVTAAVAKTIRPKRQ